MIKNTEYKFNRFVLISVMGVALGLSGCGGGGDSSTAPTNVTGVTIGGTAAKGIVKDGVVTAEQLNASGDVIATVGSATTAADGSYSLTLNNNYTGGPIQILASPLMAIHKQNAMYLPVVALVLMASQI